MEGRGSERTRNLLSLSYLDRRNRPIPYLMSAIVRGLWTPQALALCRQSGFEIQPRFRSRFSDVAWRRRFLRAIDRIRRAVALAKQGDRLIELGNCEVTEARIQPPIV
jgi:hypothetical protein